MKVWVKICGVTSGRDAENAVRAGADALGVNFWPQSARFCSEEAAREVVGATAGKAVVYGVFVGAPRSQIEAVIARTGIGAVQLHGGESAREAAGFAVPVLRAVPADSVERVRRELAAAAGHRVLLDGPRTGDGRFGGTGRTFALRTVEGLDLSDAVVAGGLGPDNVAAVVRRLRPWGVDVAGGVESAPGTKDARLMEEFVSHAKSA